MTQMHWQQLLDPSRLHGKPTSGRDEIGRSPFHKDHDRIVFSGSFRRLGRKTQVHPLTDNDHIHTRLTHSLEVGCVGRSLGMIVGELLRERLPKWITPADLGVIVQAACLGHDIGNPPFGHAGEYAIRDWFKRAEADGSGLLEGLSERERADLLTYEGNAQGFRIVTQIEYNQFRGGMRLTAATLGTLLKYPWTVEHGGSAGKFGCYQSERPLLEDVTRCLGLLPRGEGRWCRHPLAWLVEAADDICYALLDLEDGLEMGILRFEEVAEVLLQIAGDAPSDYARMARDGVSQRRRIAALRGAAMERAVNDVGAVFVEHENALLNGTLNSDLLELCHPDLGWGVAAAKQLARERIFQNERKAKLEIGAYTTLGILLEAFIGAAHELHFSGQSSFKHQRVLALIGENTPRPSWPLYDSYRRMLDFIGGMTDHYAVDLAQEMGGRLRGD
ncbi:deoxyguanosinetriphosphate triphosphohydrolase [Billgrantia desiderata]|uniref:Deoxyguanosinetriphosphate triphosphohydrolase n=1 Tax=Billgrantia desiderata TaxID=52021 RepID=A0ABS9BB58_9GAMM|nr:deoxyguanosinetriphosphate triphosphohydrolase [Halomonas desiderata]MCE8014308.1 deoxyguanosinetriphosphate triphosphohydrolase [Halomonas desiderata]MCE8031375.1 deoxyguanosinetriphosphate triphosphohydrolase [Halomonas desiderata]MCE8044794.1 deoxyguanosinetriphosphate triphosphohydrolase [Halomonas desiderata]MCE8049326.1 deoxyguanosinetriphosphate triphosphohydrolase [Halomonas desiderata]NIC38116.1 deoxyguanosinetriphosphate triphosphohydrolase [Halomonas desiderata]